MCGCGKKNPLCLLVWALVLIGVLNWGLVGLGWLVSNQNWNVVNKLVGTWPTVEAVIYILVGVAGLVKLVCGLKGCGTCGTGGGCGCGSGSCACGSGASCSCGKPGCPVCSKKM